MNPPAEQRGTVVRLELRPETLLGEDAAISPGHFDKLNIVLVKVSGAPASEFMRVMQAAFVPGMTSGQRAKALLDNGFDVHFCDEVYKMYDIGKDYRLDRVSELRQGQAGG